MIPTVIEREMRLFDLNRAERIELKDREMYSLYKVDSTGKLVPTGLPVVFEIVDKIAVRVDAKVFFELIKKEEADEE